MNATAQQLAYRAELHAPAMICAEARTHEEAARLFRSSAALFAPDSEVCRHLMGSALHHTALARIARVHANELRKEVP